MGLKAELGLKKDFASPQQEAILSIYYTASMIKKRADTLFGYFGLTDVQYNLMNLLHYESGADGGLGQSQLSEMMMVNRANVTTLIDRMEKADLVVRTAHPNDRRLKIIKLTEKGEKLFLKVKPHYIKQIRLGMSSLDESELASLSVMLGKVRGNIRDSK
ncbi:MAG: MarR family winged helix-turn-helix transcriptional regulator [Spirochaetota bacterium]|jgi:DNA-binding MarR family transcriptional regulator